jgi:hypothetical protein
MQDANWVKKVLVGGVIALVGALLFPVSWILAGYALAIIKRVYEGTDLPLPEWDDIGGYFVRGLLVSIGIFIWILPLVVIFGIVFGGAAALGDTTGSAFTLLGLCLAAPLTLLLTIFVLPIVAARYAIENRFGAMFEFGAIGAEIRRAPVPLLLTAVMAAVVSFLAEFGIIACCVGIFFTTAYAYFVIAHMVGQTYRQARGLSAQSQPTAAF